MALVLIREQVATGKRIVNFTINTEKLGEAALTFDVVQTRLTLLEKYWSETLQRHLKLQAYETENADDDYFANDLFTDYETAYSLAKSKLRARIAAHVEQVQAENEPNPLLGQTPIQVQSTATSLPKLKLPTFAGKQEDWDTFKEVFSSMVKDNLALTPILKLQHLISCLEGEAARRLANFEVIGSNFDVAWNALCRRYDNKRLRQAVQMFKLLNMAPVTQRSPSEYTRLLDTTGQCLRAFQKLRRPTDQWDDWLVHVIVYKLDQQTREDWEKALEGSEEYPSYEKLSSFLENRVRSLDNAHCSAPVKISPKPKPAARDKPRSVTAHHTQADASELSSARNNQASAHEKKGKVVCTVCQGAHIIAHCPTYLNSTALQKKNAVERLRLCMNCLRPHHSASSCTSKFRCRFCQQAHHSTLHEMPAGDFMLASTIPQHAPVSNHVPQGSQIYVSRLGGRVLLGTARVILESGTGLSHQARVLIDPASEGHFLTERVVQLLRLRKSTSQTNVRGVGCVAATSTSQATAFVRSTTNSNFVLSFSALVLPKLTSLLPSARIERHDWPHIEGLELADPDFHHPAEVDGILGADIYALIIQEGLRHGSLGTPVAQRTKLGWILTGTTRPPADKDAQSINSFSITLQPATSVAEELRRFWELEEIPSCSPLTPDEQACEEHFVRTHQRDASGRYVLQLPFKMAPFGSDNRGTAVSRMQQVERRLSRNTELGSQYYTFMSDYEILGHLETIPCEQIDVTPRRYLSHHGVMQNKLRVVFDGSCGSPSLNECLHTGAKLQSDISTVIVRWRLFKYAFAADIVKMYRQIKIHQDDADWLRIVMRSSPDLALTDKRLLTVTYGTSCAPFQALRTLLQLAEDEGHDLPLGANVLRNHMYVDDAHAGADTLAEACLMRDQFIDILRRAGMSLSKWAANEPSLLPESENSPNEHVLDPYNTVSTLGLKWSPISDVFSFTVQDAPVYAAITKRIVLSEIARLHDLFGLLAPVTVRAKMLLQLLWLSGNDWDSPISSSLQTSWIEYRQQLIEIRSLRIPRWCGTENNSEWTLFGFSDASERAYAAAIYLVCRSSEDHLQSHLIASKTRVAPTKSLSIPRLELCGAVTLARLVTQLLSDMPKNVRTVRCMTDSQVVLAWLRKPPSTWQTFVANRVSTILTILPAATWHHVRSSDNPADLATRGMTPAELIHSEQWWHGPTHIFEETSFQDDQDYDTTIERKREVASFNAKVAAGDIEDTLVRFSSLNRLLRVMSYARRFYLNYQLPAAARPPLALNALEMESTMHILVTTVQHEKFDDELSRLKNGQALLRGSRLRSLLPFIDDDDVMRVGGRLQYSHLSYDEKHPIILPATCHLSELIIRHAHQATLHGGPQLMLSYIVRRYWIIGVKSRLKSLYRKCVRCLRFQARPENQQMAPVPAVRITPGPAFETTGVDYAGPFPVRTSRGRGHKSSKGYIAIFICMVTRAVHIEVVSDYSSRTFLLAYERFTSRRGNPRTLYSDNGTTFRGANTELKRMFSAASTFHHTFAEAIANDGTTWMFIPPRGPHFGGLWEAAVKSFKFHLKRVIGTATLTFEEFSTLACRIESCLNSRPLSPLSSDPADISALTPGHFLIGRALRAPPTSPTDEKTVGVTRWRMLEAMREHFWRRWRKEVLNQFQVRSRWLVERSTPEVGDLVLLTDDSQPALHWPLARVEQLHTGSDGLTRVITLRTANSTFRRPVNKVIRLPRDDAAVDHHKTTSTRRLPVHVALSGVPIDRRAASSNTNASIATPCTSSTAGGNYPAPH